MPLLEHKVIVVTGSGRGIGKEHAIALARQGARVVVNDLGSDTTGRAAGDPSVAEAVVAEIEGFGGTAVASPDDISSEAGAQGLIDTALDRWGALDGVINNAGNIRPTPIPDASLADFRAIVDVHLMGTFLVSRAAAAYWIRLAGTDAKVDARLVNTTSSAGLWGMVGAAAYCAAKGGILSLSQCLTAELAQYGVRVNCVGPGGGTRMNSRPDDDANDRRNRPARSEMPDAAACAPLMVWLMSESSAHVTGRTFENVGGRIWVLDGWRRQQFVETDTARELTDQFDLLCDAVASAPEPMGALMALDTTALDAPPPSAIRPPLHFYPSSDRT